MVHLGLGQQPRQQQQLLQPLQPLQQQQQQHTKQGQQQRRDGPSRKRLATPRSPSSESVRQQLGDRLYIQVMHSQPERADEIVRRLMSAENAEIVRLLNSAEQLQAQIQAVIAEIAAQAVMQFCEAGRRRKRGRTGSGGFGVTPSG